MKKALFTLLVVLTVALVSNVAQADCGCKGQKDRADGKDDVKNPPDKEQLVR